MRQQEVQVGGVYISKGKGMEAGRRKKVLAILPGDPPRAHLVDLDSERNTYPRVDSFQQSYTPEKLPTPVVNQVVAARRAMPKAKRAAEEFDIKDAIEGLSKAFDRLASVLEKELVK